MPPTPNSDSPAVRQHLVQALDLDLIGPGASHELSSEQLPGWLRPSNWYLTGFLIPSGTPAEDRADVDEDECAGSGHFGTLRPPDQAASSIATRHSFGVRQSRAQCGRR